MADLLTRLVSTVQNQRRIQPLLLLLDYDGTLVETAPWPELARPTPELLELLSRLTAQGDLKVAVVSGRPLRELRELLPIPGLDLLGSHGGEALIADRLQFPQGAAIDFNGLALWRNRLARRLKPFRGWWIEDKPQGFALHYRQVPEEQSHEFIETLERCRERLRQEGGFQLLAGKKVLEILPLDVSKGAAIQEILALPGFQGFFPVYIGDDITDESAFQALGGRGLAIRVGGSRNRTEASYYLPDTKMVRNFLALLAASPEDH